MFIESVFLAKRNHVPMPIKRYYTYAIKKPSNKYHMCISLTYASTSKASIMPMMQNDGMEKLIKSHTNDVSQ